jgi:hypothetical protein
VNLTGETSGDLRLLEKGDVIVHTPKQVRECCFVLYTSADLTHDLVRCHTTKMAIAEEG